MKSRLFLVAPPMIIIKPPPLSQQSITYITHITTITIFVNKRLFMIWRLIKDLKSDIAFRVGFDYDIDTYYILKSAYSSCTNM